MLDINPHCRFCFQEQDVKLYIGYFFVQLREAFSIQCIFITKYDKEMEFWGFFFVFGLWGVATCERGKSPGARFIET
jgi:hypothetical protein